MALKEGTMFRQWLVGDQKAASVIHILSPNVRPVVLRS
jgi:hypothetical protein